MRRPLAFVALLLLCAAACRGERAAIEPPVVPTPPAEGSATPEEPVEGSATAEEAEEPPPDPVAEVVLPPTTWTVTAGDNLWDISQTTHCAVAAIRSANELEDDVIYPGQVLQIPTCTRTENSTPTVAVAGEYVIEAGDYLEAIALDHGCSVSEIQLANGLANDSIYAGQTLRIPECHGQDVAVAAEPLAEDMYQIQPGDYLGLIATQHGCAVSELMVANRLTNDYIQAGAILRIPECTGEPVEGASVASASVDHDTLPDLMRRRGFDPPRRFKAAIIEITFDRGRQNVVSERRFDYAGTGGESEGWNPASSVKLFAAVAAMQRMNELGFTGEARVTFHGRREYTATLDEVIGAALGPSDNIAYNRLVQFVGFDALNRDFLSRSNGFRSTVLRRPYARSTWMEMGGSSSFRDTPALTISEGGRTREIPERRGSHDVTCGGSACTTLLDLAECMRRLMLQEQVPAHLSYDLPRRDLLTVRAALHPDRERGEEVVGQLGLSFGANAVFFHKAGYSGEWYSDVVYIYDPANYTTQAWVVALAAHPGRESLNDAARIIGEIIASGALRRS